MLGEENSRETQFLLRAARMSLIVPPHVYAIREEEEEYKRGDYNHYSYFIAGERNVLVGWPETTDDLLEALDALGGVDLIFAQESDSVLETLIEEVGGQPFPQREAGSKLQRVYDAAEHRYLWFAGGGGVLLTTHGLISDEGRLIVNPEHPLAANRQQDVSQLGSRYQFTAVLTTLVRGNFITEGGAEALARLAGEQSPSEDRGALTGRTQHAPTHLIPVEVLMPASYRVASVWSRMVM